MGSPIQRLRERVIGGKDKNSDTALTNMLDMTREFGCLGEIIGRDFDIKDSKGKLLYLIHQKPMAIKQMNVLLKEFATLKKMDNEIEAKKWGTKNSNKSGRQMR